MSSTGVGGYILYICIYLKSICIYNKYIYIYIIILGDSTSGKCRFCSAEVSETTRNGILWSTERWRTHQMQHFSWLSSRKHNKRHAYVFLGVPAMLRIVLHVQPLRTRSKSLLGRASPGSTNFVQTPLSPQARYANLVYIYISQYKMYIIHMYIYMYIYITTRWIIFTSHITNHNDIILIPFQIRI